ncbi:hypothetical protein DL96DRAFT_1605108 [Flagelloscypha sp. PMI_526]|nr:hypothetical protein DL96DRAFT_1605108 [Flagelloscypha sp. PMI_526]
MAKTLLAALLLAGPALGQQLAACNANLGFSWAFNSKNQSPCDIASALAAPCYGGSFKIIAIGAGQFYSGPTRETESKCRCNTVFFDALSACAACQGADLSTWSGFKFNCSTIYPGLYPNDLPIPVPAYAYQDVTQSDKFNVDQAKALAQSESSASTAQATSTQGPSISIAPPSATSEPSSGKSVSVGAIAGGTVGGVIGAVLIGFGNLDSRNLITPPDPNSPPFAGFGLPNSPSARSTDVDATYGTSITPYMVGDQSMDTHTNYYPGAPSLERRPSSPEI